MAPLNAEEDTLGEKHRKYNKLVKEAISTKNIPDEKNNQEDLNNLLQIDIASYNKNVDYILNVLKSKDILYVSRAIKQCTWLVDDQYADIINPEYLNDHLFPQMTTKASSKLLKHVRHYLKTETRVEQFYKNEANLKVAVKWLSRCSVPFIEANISKHMSHITNMEFKRLCEKSVTIFETAMKDHNDSSKLKAASILLHTHADKYFDVFDNTHRYSRPTFGPAATKLIMKQIPDRIMKNFLMYMDYVHIPTFITSVKREDIKKFLFDIANEVTPDVHRFTSMFHFRIIKHFVKRLPKEEQFGFVKKVFLDKENIEKIEDETLTRGTEMFAIKKICLTVWSGTPIYHWYEFAPFSIAFDEIKKLLQSESNKKEKYSMLNVLLNCAGSNTKDVLTLLVYYFKNNLNDDIREKRKFINNLLSRTEIYKNDDDTWNAFIEILMNLNVYTENNNQEYIEVIILYHALKNKPVSEIIENSFSFNSLKKYRKTLNQEEQNKVFRYLYNYMIKKVESHNIQNENDLSEGITLLLMLLDLFIDWDQQLADYPFVIDKIKDLARIKNDNSWKANLSPLYNKEKSWRRLMFEESVILHPCQNVCINALKHDPGLLVRFKSNVDALCCDDTVSLKQLLRKLRIYWPESLADSWTKSYLSQLDKLSGQKALTRGLCTILTEETLLDIINKYAPAQAKIDWNNTNELTLGLQRCIAKNMHIARPQPEADTILLYAKGDFLQYALPSLLAIYYNMSRLQSQEQIPKLLNAPVSLQKHGLRLAFMKLKHEELKFHLSNVWKTSKNISIRAVSFVLLFDLICKENDSARTEELLDILEVFMDNLSFKEDKKIYDKLPNVEALPKNIQSKFLVKSYKFLKSLLPHVKNDRATYEHSVIKLAHYTRELMESICPEFVADIITEYLNVHFFNAEVQYIDENMLSVISAYLLCAKDEESQTMKYEKILVPLIKRALDQWDETRKEAYFVRHNFQRLLTRFSLDLNEYVLENKMIIPLKMFKNIQIELSNNLIVSQNYTTLTMWKLIVKMTEILENNEKPENLSQISSGMVTEFGKYCLEVLKEDVKSYFPCIYVLYAKVLNMTIIELLPNIVRLQIYDILLTDKDFVQAFLVTLKVISETYSYCDDEYKEKEKAIRKLIRDHPTVEVKMHYYSTYKDEDGND